MIRRACANRAILPRKPSKITVKAVYVRRPISGGQYDQVDVHAKTALTEILARFDSASVGRMARTGLGVPGTGGKCHNPRRTGAHTATLARCSEKELTDDLHCNLQH